MELYFLWKLSETDFNVLKVPCHPMLFAGNITVGGCRNRGVHCCLFIVLLGGHVMNCLLLFMHVDGLGMNCLLLFKFFYACGVGRGGHFWCLEV